VNKIQKQNDAKVNNMNKIVNSTNLIKLLKEYWNEYCGYREMINYGRIQGIYNLQLL
jgi:hypothetical protein